MSRNATPLQSMIYNENQCDIVAADGGPLAFRTAHDARLFVSRDLHIVLTSSSRLNDKHTILPLMPLVVDGFVDVCPVCRCVCVSSPLSLIAQYRGRGIHVDCLQQLPSEATERKIDDGTELYAIARYLRNTIGGCDAEADLIEDIVERRFPDSPRPTDALFDELYPVPDDDEPYCRRHSMPQPDCEDCRVLLAADAARVRTASSWTINDMPRQRGDDSTPIELRKNGAHLGQFWSYDSAILAAIADGATYDQITSDSEVVRLVLDERRQQASA